MSAVVAIGKFDALHRGHRALVAAAARLGAPALLSFADMAAVLGWEPRPPLCDCDERQRVLRLWGAELQQTVVDWRLPFAEVRELTPAAFVDLLVARFGIGGIVTGRDYRFGYRRSGGVELLAGLCAERGLRHRIVDPVQVDGRVVSSTAVREALATGDVATLTRLLDRPYRLSGSVVAGAGRGRGIGIPTANIATVNQPPGAGVYAVRAELADGSVRPGAMNVGRQPSFGPDNPPQVEVHLLDWRGDCYGRPLAVDLLARLRGERRFAGIDELVAQIRTDIAEVRALTSPG